MYRPYRRLVLLTLCLPAIAHAGLSFEEATRLARAQAPALAVQSHALAGAQAAQPAATTLPDPRLTLGVDNLPLSGADRYSLTRDFMTMQRIGLMQEVPNRAKRVARAEGAEGRVQRERAMLAAVQLAVQRDASLAWLSLYFAQARLARLAELMQENSVLLSTLDARITGGRAMPAERTMARQEALALADRHDDMQRGIHQARAALRRFVGARADEALEGAPPPLAVQPEQVRAGLHRHAELAPYEGMQAMARAELAEASAEQRGDWGWELAYSRRGAQYGDMVSAQVSFDLPWQRGQRQQPQEAAKRHELLRIEAEREDSLRRHREEIESQLAQWQALEAQRGRLLSSGVALAAERVSLALASYQAGRGDLGAVLAARREAVEVQLRLIDLDEQRSALGVRLSTLIAE